MNGRSEARDWDCDLEGMVITCNSRENNVLCFCICIIHFPV